MIAAARIGGMTRAGLALTSAALYAASFPLLGWHLCIWVCLVPLMLALRGASLLGGAGLGLLWGTATIWGIGYWVPQALAHYWEQPVWLGLLLALAGSLIFMGSYGAGFGASAAALRSRTPAARVISLAALWVAWEVARGQLLSGDPWLLLGYGPTPWPLFIQIADLGGVYLVSFVVALVNAGIAETLLTPRRWRAHLLVPFTALAGTVVYGALRLDDGSVTGRQLRLAVVQANVDFGAHWRNDNYGRGVDEHIALARQAPADTALFIWPESALNVFLAREPLYQKQIGHFLAARQADLIVGAPHLDDRDPARPHYFNSAFSMTADGGLVDRYDKVHLLPFGEYFPLRGIELLSRRFERVRSFTPGSEARLLQTRFGPLAVVICFEAIFPGLVRQRMQSGAELLVNLSNDAWLGPDAGPEQHLAMIPMRAVENRTWVVRATTTGVSALIDPSGRIRQRSPTGAAALLVGDVGLQRQTTVYEEVGDVVAWLCIVAGGLALVPRRRGLL